MMDSQDSFTTKIPPRHGFRGAAALYTLRVSAERQTDMFLALCAARGLSNTSAFKKIPVGMSQTESMRLRHLMQAPQVQPIPSLSLPGGGSYVSMCMSSLEQLQLRSSAHLHLYLTCFAIDTHSDLFCTIASKGSQLRPNGFLLRKSKVMVALTKVLISSNVTSS